MSFKVGQKLSSDISDTLNPVWSETINGKGVIKVIDKLTNAAGSIDSQKKFTDKAISIQGKFQPNTHYYIKIAIERKFPKLDQDLTLQLARKEDLQEITQYIDNFTVFAPENDSKMSDYAFYETIITPNNTYEQLEIILTRSVVDYYSDNNPETGTYWETETEREAYEGREITINPDLCQIATFNKVLNFPVNKIGIQGPPGLLMCINGEPIRIGPSGIYQIRNGYKVDFLSFVKGKSQQSDGTYGVDNFIIDYQYESND